MTPLQVLERQNGFLLRYQHDEGFRHYIAGCFSPHQAWSTADRDRGEEYVAAVRTSFEMAEAYRVTPEMCDLVQFSADKLDESDRIDKTLAPTPFGFVAFEKPLPVWDARGEKMLVHYLTWGPISVGHVNALTGKMEQRAGFWISMWNDGILHPDETTLRLKRLVSTAKRMNRDISDLQRTMGHYGFVGTESFADRDVIGPRARVVTEESRARMLEEDKRYFGEEFSLHVPPPIGEYTNSSRYVHALWLLLNQTLTSVTEEPLSKGAAKLAGRMKIPGRVSVIQLRRRETRKSEGETHVEWQHRWLVRGHWRWQPYADGTVKRIWINGFVKGPEDKPFAQTTHLYNLSR